MALGPTHPQAKALNPGPQRLLTGAVAVFLAYALLAANTALMPAAGVVGAYALAVAVGAPIPGWSPKSVRTSLAVVLIIIAAGAMTGWAMAGGMHRFQGEARGQVRDEAQASTRKHAVPVLPATANSAGQAGKGGAPVYSLDIKPIGQSPIRLHVRLQA